MNNNTTNNNTHNINLTSIKDKKINESFTNINDYTSYNLYDIYFYIDNSSISSSNLSSFSYTSSSKSFNVSSSDMISSSILSILSFSLWNHEQIFGYFILIKKFLLLYLSKDILYNYKKILYNYNQIFQKKSNNLIFYINFLPYSYYYIYFYCIFLISNCINDENIDIKIKNEFLELFFILGNLSLLSLTLYF